MFFWKHLLRATQANSGEKDSYGVVSVEQISFGLPLVTVASVTDGIMIFRGKIRDQLISQSKDAAQISDEVTSSSWNFLGSVLDVTARCNCQKHETD